VATVLKCCFLEEAWGERGGSGRGEDEREGERGRSFPPFRALFLFLRF
jgi:hypothetical protein